ncbi:MAG TPA: ATP-binding protein [Gammaproteobacteria bacterium]|nr:ATP-binding protein [Gammaproteobacteria bacterium]
MKRTLTVIVLGLAALALLVGAAIKSRSIPLETHIARYTLDSDIKRLDDELVTLVNSLETAWQSSQAPGEAAVALHQRIVASPEILSRSVALIPGNSLQREGMQNHLERVKTTMVTVDELTTTLLDEQAQYFDNLTLLRDSGADVVRQLRELGQARVAADLFQLVAETIEFAGSDRPIGEYEIRRLLTSLTRDQRIDATVGNLSGPLLAAVTSILAAKDDIRSRLTQLGSVSLIANADALNLAAASAYQSATSSAESARTMLSIYAVVMLLSVGVIGFRLSGSYRELNRANEELALLNESLEQRVHERTEDLSNALAELKESQVQLVQAEKMSSLGQLVAGISHEINTPLLYLANNASLIQERIAALQEYVQRSAEALSLNPSDFDDRSEYQARLIQGLKKLKLLLRELELEASVEEIVDLNRDSIEGLADLTEMAQSLKDFSRLDRAPVDSFDVNAGLDKTLNIARNIVKHKAEVRKFYGEIPRIECSPSKINQVFLNLITNAAQAIEDHGEIVISTKLKGDSHIVIAISDTGCGIPEENLAKIRDPFFTTKEVGTGTGLGLSIVDEIVRSHGGELLVDSKVGKGSTFAVVLPIKHENEPDVGEVECDAVADAWLAEAV